MSSINRATYIDSGLFWDISENRTVTYSFVDLPNFDPQGYNSQSGLITAKENIVSAVDQIFQVLGQILNVNFQKLANNSQSGDIAFSLTTSTFAEGGIAVKQYEDTTGEIVKSGIWLSQLQYFSDGQIRPGTELHQLLLHEIGHVLGLEHGSEYPQGGETKSPDLQIFLQGRIRSNTR